MKKALTMSLFLILLNMVFAQQFWLNMPTPTTKNLTKYYLSILFTAGLQVIRERLFTQLTGAGTGQFRIPV